MKKMITFNRYLLADSQVAARRLEKQSATCDLRVNFQSFSGIFGKFLGFFRIFLRIFENFSRIFGFASGLSQNFKEFSKIF